MIEIGDIVSLKSGGPDMTVMNLHEEKKVTGCAWFYQRKPDSTFLPSATLQLLRASHAKAGLPPIGATIRLRSGGPPMKVTGVQNDFVTFDWKNIDGDVERGMGLPQCFALESMPVSASAPAVTECPFKIGDRVLVENLEVMTVVALGDDLTTFVCEAEDGARFTLDASRLRLVSWRDLPRLC